MRAALALCVGVALSACVPERASHPVTLRVDHEEPELIRVVHVVKPGHTLYRVARAYGLTADELMAANGISDPRTLSVGQELLIPGASETVEVEPAPSLVGGQSAGGSAAVAEAGSGGKAVETRSTGGRITPPATGSQRRPDPEEARAARPDPRKGTLDWPLRGVLYGRFGKKGKEPHDGVDLAAPSGTPVKTAAPGQVLYAGLQRGYGKIVIVEHADDLVTLYAHNRDLRVKSGQKVRKGQVIATVGDSGRTSGPHLHFEVRKSGRPVDPLSFLGPVPRK